MKTHVTIGMQALQKVLSMYPKNSFITMGVDIAGVIMKNGTEADIRTSSKVRLSRFQHVSWPWPMPVMP